ncbi:hypothetical protein VTH82DRAFT_2705, partial [Thermothelomyces myriococcoides]
MDGHPDREDRHSASGDVFHRHSHSSSNHLPLDFSLMMHAQLAASHQVQSNEASAAAGGTYGSHDDLCIDRCMGVGLYNGFQQFNHRGAPPSLQSRWARGDVDASSRYSFQMGLHDVPMQFRSAELGSPAANFYQQQQQQQQQQQPPPQWYGQQQQLTGCAPCTDEDCRSMAGSCCDSECTMTDKCTNAACAGTEDACTDQTCPERPPVALPSEVVSGAAALISINHAPGETADHQFGNLQQP